MSTNKFLAILAVIIILGAVVFAVYRAYWAEDEETTETIKAEHGDIVEVTYIGFLKDQRMYGSQSRVFDTCIEDVAQDDVDYPKTTTFDNRTREGSFTFTVGEGNVIVGWEKNVIGMVENQTSTWVVPPSEAYEPYLENLLVTVPKVEVSPVLERVSKVDFTETYGMGSMKPGQVLEHGFWGWPASVEYLDNSTDEVVIRNEPQSSGIYDSGYGWEIQISQIDGTANGGVGEISFDNRAELADKVPLAPVEAWDEDTFGGIRDEQAAKQRPSSSGVVSSVTQADITIDFNNEVYGKELTFVVTLKKISRPSTEEEE